MPTIETKTPPYHVGDVAVDRLEVGSIGFVAYCAAGDAASKRAKTDKDLAKNLFRERIKRQVKAYTADGKPVALDDAAILSMPLRHALALKAAIDSGGNAATEPAPVCEMLDKGDGMSAPIHIRLGTPIKAADGKEIKELEFIAKTLGDVEDLVAAGNQLERTLAVLAIAKPVEGTLMLLPSWAVDQITLNDGAWIMSEVVPSFLLPCAD